MWKLINPPPIGEVFYLKEKTLDNAYLIAKMDNKYALIHRNVGYMFIVRDSIQELLECYFNNDELDTLYYQESKIMKKYQPTPNLMDIFTVDNHSYFLQEVSELIILYEISSNKIYRKGSYEYTKSISYILQTYFGPNYDKIQLNI